MPAFSTGAVNWVTAYQHLVDETKQRADENITHVKLSICRAIRYYRTHSFHFNLSTTYFYLMEDYPIVPIGSWGYDATAADEVSHVSLPTDGSGQTAPADILTVKSIKLRPYPNDSDFWTRPLDHIGEDTMRELQALGSPSVPGEPEFFTRWNKSLQFHPIPREDYLVKLDYTRDLGSPYALYEGETTGWKFYDPTGAEMVDSFTSPWFNEASELINARAKWILYRQYLDDQGKAIAARELEIESLASLEKMMTNMNEAVEIVPEYP